MNVDLLVILTWSGPEFRFGPVLASLQFLLQKYTAQSLKASGNADMNMAI